MEIALYLFATIGAFVPILLLAVLVSTLCTHGNKISQLEKVLKDLEQYYDGRMDRMFDRVNELENRVTGVEETLTEEIISSLKPRLGVKRK